MAVPAAVEAALDAASSAAPPDMLHPDAAAIYQEAVGDTIAAIRAHLNTAPSVEQLVVADAASTDPQVVAETVGKGDTPIDFEDPNLGLSIPRFGTGDMLHLAGYAIGRGWALTSVEFIDGAHQALPAEENESLSSQVCAHLGGARADDVWLWLIDAHPQLTVAALHLRDPDGHDASVTRLGTLTGTQPGTVAELIHEAWVPLRLA